MNKAIEAYESAISACKQENKIETLFANKDDFELKPIDKYLLQREASGEEEEKKGDDETSITPVIHGGIELNILEAGYTQTLFYLAQVYSQKGEVEQGIKYCAQTMTRQMANKTYQLKDFCVNCLNLANYFILQKNFAQAEYLLYTAQTLLPED